MSSRDSLIQQAKAQMDLLPSSAMAAALFEEDEQRGEFTAERLWKQKPELYAAVVAMSAEGLGQIRIGQYLKVSPNTVRAVQLREGVSIDIEKQGLANLAHQGARLAWEGVIEDLSDKEKRAKIPTRDKALTGAMLVDKGQLLSGEATQRIEATIATVSEHDAYNDYLETMKRATAVETGSMAGNPAQKGAGIAEAAPGEAAAQAKPTGEVAAGGRTVELAVDQAAGTVATGAGIDSDSEGKPTKG